MPVRTPEPRLPLEPEEYPLYKPPGRVGCSGLTLVTLIALVVFAVFLWRLGPTISRSVSDLPAALSGSAATPVSTPGEGAMATQTVEAAGVISATAATATPQRQCVVIAATGGQGTPMRDKPSPNAARVVHVGEGAILQVIGPDQTGGTDSAGSDLVWKEVQLLPPDHRFGYILAKYLQSTACP